MPNYRRPAVMISKKTKFAIILFIVSSLLETMRSVVFYVELLMSSTKNSLPNYIFVHAWLFVILAFAIFIVNKVFDSGRDFHESLLSLSPMWMKALICITWTYFLPFGLFGILSVLSENSEYRQYWKLRETLIGNILLYNTASWFLYVSLKRINSSCR